MRSESYSTDKVSIQAMLQAKMKTPQQALSEVSSGWRIFVGTACATPRVLIGLAAAGGELARISGSDRPPTFGRVLSVVGVSSLKKRAAEPGCMGVTARRVLETIAVRAGFYLPRDLFAAGRYRHETVALELAVEAKPDSAPLWYNLACARAGSGDPGEAVEALERAVQAGYRDLAYLEADADLESIRGEPGYRALVERLRVADTPTATPASR